MMNRKSENPSLLVVLDEMLKSAWNRGEQPSLDSFPSAKGEELAEALIKAGHLLSMAYEVGTSAQNGTASDQELISSLELAYPGFATSRYEAVLEYGKFLAK